MYKTLIVSVVLMALITDSFSQNVEEGKLQYEYINGVKARNVIFILSDDHRWDYMGFTGKIPWLKTPAMDRLAREGVFLRNTYVTTSLCSPSRASVLTGQEEARHGINSAHGHLPPEEAVPVYQENPKPTQRYLLPHSKRFITPETVTIGEAFLNAGYKTAHLGKWHVGLTKPYWPENNGFEVTFHSAPDPGPPGPRQ